MQLKFLEKVFFAIVFFFILLGVYYSQTDLKYYNSVYTREDGLLEWLTVLALVVGAGTCFYRVSILKPFRSWKFQAGLILMGLVFLFGAGEEISWGQRIFDIQSPAFFLKHNSQGETNLHNLVVSGTKINKLVFGLILGVCVALYLLVLPTLYKKFEKIKNLVNTFAIPVPRAIHVISYIILALLAETIAGGKKGEILEFGGCWIFTLMLFNPLNREVFSRRSFER